MTDGRYDKDEEEFDVGIRALCADGSCIGVLDSHGRCKVCGQQGTPSATPAGDSLVGDSFADEAVAATSVAHDDDFAPAATATDDPADAAGDDFADRRLCSDPSCIGVLDAEGRCKECGRSESNPPPAGPYLI